MLARPLYRFAAFDLGKVPGPQRGKALQLQVQDWAPFRNAGLYVIWQGAQALVWAWRTEAVATAMAAEGVDRERIEALPETVLQPRPAVDGSRLVACLEGFEGQVWNGGVLLASRWWPTEPDATQWRVFERDAGLQPDDQGAAALAVQSVGLASEPWQRSQSLDQGASTASRRERWAVQGAAVALAAMTFWYGAQLVKLSRAKERIAIEQQELLRQAQPLLAARGEALEAMSRLRALHGITARYPEQVVLMAKVAEAMPRDGTFLKAWDFADNKLKVQISSAGAVQTSEWIRRFESLGPFRNVQIVPGNDPTTLTLGMETLAPAEQRLAAAPANAIR